VSDLVRYSKIQKKLSMRFLKKKYKESDYTILYDVGFSKHSYVNIYLLKDIKNLVIDSTKTDGINLPCIQAENIFFSGYDNLGGITIPYEAMKANGREYYFYWCEEHPSKIKKINIITKNGVKTIDVDNLENFQTSKRKYIASFSFTYENDKKVMEYIIDKEENIKEKKLAYLLDESDINNNSINMKDYIDYEEIVLDIDNNIRVKDLIIDKTCMKDLYKLYDVISYAHYDRLVIIDNDEMKLHPETTILYNTSIKDIEIYQDPNNIFYIVYKKEKIIYMDNNKIKVIDIKKIYDENIVDINIYIEEHNGKHDPIIIIKYRNNSTKIIKFNKIIELDELYMDYALYKFDTYFNDDKKIKKLIRKNDFYTMFEKKYIDFYKIEMIYSYYLEFIKKINELKNKGFSNDAIKYLYENHFDNIIDLDDENKINLNDITNEEIDKFNELGNIYIKRKKLNK